MNVQALTTPEAECVYLGPTHPGSVHDLTAARDDDIIQAVTDANIETTADSGYQGAGGTVRTPIKRPKGKGHNGFEKQANSALSQLRAAAEHPFAALKRWRILDRVRISPNRIITLIRALFVIHRERSSLARA
jgi:hypothetical protein